MAKKKHALSLRKRPSILFHLNTRTQREGDDDVPACDISLQKILLTGSELCALTGDEHAYAHFFQKGKKNEPDEPAPIFRLCKPIALRDKFKDCSAVLSNGDALSIDLLADVKIARIKLEPQTGGNVAMSCQVQATPDPDQMSKLYALQKRQVDVKLVFGAKAEKEEKQTEIPLDGGGPNAAETPDTEPDDDEGDE